MDRRWNTVTGASGEDYDRARRGSDRGDDVMRAVMLQVPPDLLEQRRRIGADRWDEVWDGVLHMVPTPNREQQDVEGALEAWLRRWWAPRTGGKVYHQINVARPGFPDWRKDYRVPDLVLLTPQRAGIDRNEFFAGGPDAVVEIQIPDDETYEKIPFYAAVGVREVWVVDRDTRAVEVHALDRERPARTVRREPEAEGWIRSALGVELRTEAGRRLALRVVEEPGSIGPVP